LESNIKTFSGSKPRNTLSLLTLFLKYKTLYSVFLLLLRSRPLVFRFPAAAAEQALGSFPLRGRKRALLRGKLKPRAAIFAAVAEPTLWVWLC
jgi:hypothetical protein